MCTCMTYQGQDFYFGRNLDLECGFGEKVVITPRNYRFHFTNGEKREHHFAMIGMASVMDHYPLYAEAVNEKGLGMAGLIFPGNAVYRQPQEGRINLAVYELIPYLLTACACVKEAGTSGKNKSDHAAVSRGCAVGAAAFYDLRRFRQFDGGTGKRRTESLSK